MVTKIQTFKNKDPIQLAEDINKFNEKNNGFSTQVFPSSPWSEYWVAFVYYDKSNLNPFGKKEDGLRGYGHTRENPSPSNKQEPATKNQLEYIYKNNLDVDTENLTKKEAFIIISEDKRRRK